MICYLIWHITNWLIISIISKIQILVILKNYVGMREYYDDVLVVILPAITE